MDFVAKQRRRDPSSILAETMEAFKPLWEKKRSQIESVPKKTFKYGKTDRHQLDVYYPTTVSGSKHPILLFTYGGGLYIGDRSLKQCNHLAYGNLGAFFSTNGYVTVIADYRLIPHGANYPDPVDDIYDAVVWIVSNMGVSDQADIDRIYMMGHSAGAIIQSTMLLRPEGHAAGLHKRIKGVILNGGVYELSHYNSMAPTFASAYFGDAYRAARYMPQGLLNDASEAIVESLPPILLIAAEKEPDETYAQTDAFERALKERGVKDVTRLDTKGHSHVSANYALFTGEGEEWGYQVLDWMKAY